MSGIGVDTTPRSIATIAREIRRDWKAPYFGAVPYLDAMRELDTMQDKFMADSAKTIVTYFLSNAAQWRGPVARRVKAELKAMMRDKPAPVKAKARGFTTRMFYGRVSVRHYDPDHIVRIANIINKALIDAGESTPVNIQCEWIDHVDGVETVDAVWGGDKWAPPAAK
jgi:hypothetical protein